MARQRKAHIFVAVIATLGVVVAGALGTFGLVRQQQRQSAYLADISSRLARMETDLASRITQAADSTASRLQMTDLNRGIAEFNVQRERQFSSGSLENCRLISKLPARIDRPGVYCLRNNLHYSLLGHEDAITVAADDVTIDLNGGSLRGHDTADTISAGIYSAGYRNLVVSNGAISGFMWGIRYDAPPPERKGGGTLAFHDLIVRDSKFRGIYVDFGAGGEGSVAITRSIIDRVGGSTATTDSFAIGIELKHTKSCGISDNRIVDVQPVGLGEGVGISFTRANGGCVAEHNYFLNSERSEWGRTIGVWPGSEADNPSFIFRNNVIYNYTYPFMYNSGVTVFSDNLFHSPACSPRNVDYFALYKSSNRWLNEAAVCADHPKNFRAAAEAGDRRAQYRLGRTFWEGVATPGSKDAAWHWFGLAARNGSLAAREWIESQRDAHARDSSWWIPEAYRE